VLRTINILLLLLSCTNILAHDSLLIGKRAFYHVSPKKRGCSECHRQEKPGQFNWSPSAREIALRAIELDEAEFTELVFYPYQSDVIVLAHDSLCVTDSLSAYLHYFLKDLSREPEKKTINWPHSLGLFLSLFLVIAFFLLRLAGGKWSKTYSFFIWLSLFAAFYFTHRLMLREGSQEGYMPQQPVKFSHKIHAGENKIECLYCHHHVEESSVAGIPSMELCMNCHIVVREGSNSGNFELRKVFNTLDSGKVIPWIRVHNLPKHAKFNHAVHVKQGKLDCTECHGEVEKMNEIKQEHSLNMGWCNRCHKNSGTDSTTTYQLLQHDCMKCHY